MEGIESAEPEVRLTESLRGYISGVLSERRSQKEFKLGHIELEIYTDPKTKTVPFRIVRKVYEQLKTGGEDIYLHTLLEDSDVDLPTVHLPPRNPELESRIQMLKRQQAQREYKEMTRNVDREQQKHPLQLNVGQEVKALNAHMIAVFNFLFTVGGAFAFGYKATEYAFGPDFFPMQMMAGLICGTVVFFADLYFLVKHTDS